MISLLSACYISILMGGAEDYILFPSLQQLPYLDTKHEYLWGNLQISDVVSPHLQLLLSSAPCLIATPLPIADRS
jgi:chloride channel 3/4/5